MLNFIGAGAGVSEPGLNRWPDKNNLPLRYGGGLKILWRRPSWVQVPPPAPLCSKILRVYEFVSTSFFGRVYGVEVA